MFFRGKSEALKSIFFLKLSGPHVLIWTHVEVHLIENLWDWDWTPEEPVGFHVDH